MDKTDFDTMRAELMKKTMKDLRAIAKSDGICLGYDGARKDTAVNAIVGQRRYRAREQADG